MVTEPLPVAIPQVYRTVATRGSLVYFLIDNLNALGREYHYSMANFVMVLKKVGDALHHRITALILVWCPYIFPINGLASP